MSSIFSFGEKIPEYDYKVINERDARASAGIMFLLGLLSLFSLFMFRTLFYAEVFSITFILEFAIRIFVNPKYAPYMVLGSLIVSNQEPDWVEAKPKKFAWVLGLLLGFIMAYFILFNIMTPARMLTCVICLILLYLEAVFGICLGCILYHKLNIKLENCPGGVCEVEKKYPTQRLKKAMITLLYLILFVGLYGTLKTYKYSGGTSVQTMTQEERDLKEFESDDEDTSTQTTMTNPVKIAKNSPVVSEKSAPSKESDKKDCTPPQWAIDMGHREMWKEHNGCK